ncbi:ABC transporter permease [Anaerostipes sp.]|uniref:ABC transporter permease n=1 Tax=Anaerostipes sp. TaxID=1872530 RepID=UPI0025C39903|nr:ABC transporter permease [Anaerostipes sp.]MBS7008701.1 ABC transporter permease [Anaerostipes sp.]
MKAVTKLSQKNLKQNRGRSILTGISIFLTTALLTIIGLSCNGLVKANKANNAELYGDFHGAFMGVSQEKMQEIAVRGEIEKAGVTANAATVSLGKASGILSYYDQKARSMTNLKMVGYGRVPVEENEIIAQKTFFQKLGLKEPKIGDSVSVPYRVGGEGRVLKKTFKITGFLPQDEMNDLRQTYGAVISKKFYESAVPEKKRAYTVCFKMRNDQKLTQNELEKSIQDLRKKLSIPEKNVSLNKIFIMWDTDPGTETIAVGAFMAAVIILFSIVVIYNIFYVGMIQKVQEYGKLRAIGMTRKQMKQMIFREGMILSGISIPLGLVIGFIGTKLFFVNIAGIGGVNKAVGEVISDTPLFSLPVMVGAGVLALLTVYLSMKRPMQTAAKISPVEAVRYQESTGKKRQKRKGYRQVNLIRITKSNLARNRKRTVTTILTMGLSCVMFIVIANLGGNMNPAYEAGKNVKKGQFYITLDTKLDDKTYPEKNLNRVQQQHLMDKKMTEQIRQIDGVTKVETGKWAAVHAEKKGEEGTSVVQILSKKDFDAFVKEELKRGNADYDDLKKENGVVYLWDHFFEEYGYRIGEKIKMNVLDGTKKIPVTVTLSGSANAHMDASWAMTEETFKKLGVKSDLTSEIYVSCRPEKKAAVEKKLKELTDMSEFYNIQSYDDAYKEAQFGIGLLRDSLYALLFVIGLIGFMNMANTLITSIVTRKKELGIFQAIGMTAKQVRRMLQMEGLIFTVGTLVIALTLGNIAGYVLFLKCKETGMIGLNDYHLPLPEILVMAGILLFLQMVLSAVMSRKFQRESVVERIRHDE